jgi:tetratricopeptide (TPR) repeat protein
MKKTIVQSKVQKALRFHQSGMIPEAQALYRDIIKEDPKHFDSCHLLGVSLIQSGSVREGISMVLRAIKLKPTSAEAYYNLAHGWQSLRDFEGALSCLERAIAFRYNDPEYHFERGNVLTQLNRPKEAIASYEEAVRLQPSYFEVYNNLGTLQREIGEPERAISSYDKAINLKPAYAEAFYNRGNALKELDRLDEALASYDKAISLKPDYAAAFHNRGNTLKELDRLDEALVSHDKAISLKPDYAEAHSNRGNTLKELHRFDEALASYDEAISLKPDNAEAYSNRGNTLSELNRPDDALASHDKAISLKPDYAEAYSNRGNALRELGRLDEALASYDKAITLKPSYAGSYYNKAMLLLAEQHYQDGFSLYSWRWSKKDSGSKKLSTTIPVWSGNSVERLLLWAEQGIGDELFFSSMIPLISDVLSITLSADKRLHNLYKRSFPHLNLIDRTIQKQPVNSGFDAQAAVGDLGQLLRISRETIKQTRYPFLVSSAERTQEHLKNNEFLRKNPVCGIAWQSKNKKIGDRKSIALQDLEPLLRTTGITFVNLQYGDVTGEINDVARDIGTIVHQAKELDVFNDIDGLLSLIEACDIVLTTSNVTAHLAGALGKKAAVLVPRGKGRIWYWHHQPESIWYPSLRLFNQSDNFDWQDAIAESIKWIEDNI